MDLELWDFHDVEGTGEHQFETLPVFSGRTEVRLGAT